MGAAAKRWLFARSNPSAHTCKGDSSSGYILTLSPAARTLLNPALTPSSLYIRTRAATHSIRTVFDPAAGQAYVSQGQARRTGGGGGGGGAGPSGRGGGRGGGGGGGPRIVGFSDMKDMGNPPCGGGG